MNKDFLYVMYMGGPDSLDAIEPFLYNLFTDRKIIDFGIGELPQKLLAKIISKRRSKKIAPEYKKMGGSSPQLKILESLLQKVSFSYMEKNSRELSYSIGMCYYHPYIKDTVKMIYSDNYDKIFVMTMYPQYSYTTSGSCFSRFFDSINLKPVNRRFKVISYWHLNDSYNRCIIYRILEKSKEFGVGMSDIHLLFSAHSLPFYTVEKGDIYTKHIEEQVNYIVREVKPKSFSISYQSKAGRMKWLEPSTKDEIDRLVRDGYKNVLVLPISFVSDHIETLIEIDEQYIPYAYSKGLNCKRVDSLNDSEDFAKAIVDIIDG